MRLTLLQPPYPHGGRQTYLPGSLMNVGSRLMGVGASVDVFDLNHVALTSKEVQSAVRASDIIGLTVLGTPYLPVVRKIVSNLRAQGHTQRVLIGGEGAIRLTPEQFAQVFRDSGDVRLIADDGDLARAIGFVGTFPSMFEASMVPMLKRLSRAELTRYFTREFCLFLSYGCIYDCHFCAAAKNQRERYRSLEALREEVQFICAFLASIKHPRIEFYLSNLDVLQTPYALEESLTLVDDISHEHGVRVQARGLATTKCFVKAAHKDPHLPRRLRRCGLQCIGFGADGADIRVWARENKRHNTLEELEEALELCKRAGITPEMFMVTGFPEDDLTSMWAAMRYSLRQVRQGVVIRPYLGKQGAPGSKLWSDGEITQGYLEHPERFALLDYAMVGSTATHPDRRQRWLANASYLGLLAALALIGRPSTTFPLLPVPKHGPTRWISRLVNRLMPFDR